MPGPLTCCCPTGTHWQANIIYPTECEAPSCPGGDCCQPDTTPLCPLTLHICTQVLIDLGIIVAGQTCLSHAPSGNYIAWVLIDTTTMCRYCLSQCESPGPCTSYSGTPGYIESASHVFVLGSFELLPGEDCQDLTLLTHNSTTIPVSQPWTYLPHCAQSGTVLWDLTGVIPSTSTQCASKFLDGLGVMAAPYSFNCYPTPSGYLPFQITVGGANCSYTPALLATPCVDPGGPASAFAYIGPCCNPPSNTSAFIGHFATIDGSTGADAWTVTTPVNGGATVLVVVDCPGKYAIYPPVGGGDTLQITVGSGLCAKAFYITGTGPLLTFAGIANSLLGGRCGAVLSVATDVWIGDRKPNPSGPLDTCAPGPTPIGLGDHLVQTSVTPIGCSALTTFNALTPTYTLSLNVLAQYQWSNVGKSGCGCSGGFLGSVTATGTNTVPLSPFPSTFPSGNWVWSVDCTGFSGTGCPPPDPVA